MRLKKSPKIGIFYVFKASLLEEQKKLDDASGLAWESKRSIPREEKLLYYLGTLYDKQSKIESALALMNQLLEFNPDNVQALYYVGYTYPSKGIHLKRAEEMIVRALNS